METFHSIVGTKIHWANVYIPERRWKILNSGSTMFAQSTELNFAVKDVIE